MSSTSSSSSTSNIPALDADLLELFRQAADKARVLHAKHGCLPCEMNVNTFVFGGGELGKARGKILGKFLHSQNDTFSTANNVVFYNNGDRRTVLFKETSFTSGITPSSASVPSSALRGGRMSGSEMRDTMAGVQSNTAVGGGESARETGCHGVVMSYSPAGRPSYFDLCQGAVGEICVELRKGTSHHMQSLPWTITCSENDGKAGSFVLRHDDCSGIISFTGSKLCDTCYNQIHRNKTTRRHLAEIAKADEEITEGNVSKLLTHSDNWVMSLARSSLNGLVLLLCRTLIAQPAFLKALVVPSPARPLRPSKIVAPDAEPANNEIASTSAAMLIVDGEEEHVEEGDDDVDTSWHLPKPLPLPLAITSSNGTKYYQRPPKAALVARDISVLRAGTTASALRNPVGATASVLSSSPLPIDRSESVFFRLCCQASPPCTDVDDTAKVLSEIANSAASAMDDELKKLGAQTEDRRSPLNAYDRDTMGTMHLLCDINKRFAQKLGGNPDPNCPVSESTKSTMSRFFYWMKENLYMKIMRNYLFMPSRTDMREKKAAMRTGEYGGPLLDIVRKFAYAEQAALQSMAANDCNDDELTMARLCILATDGVHVDPSFTHNFNTGKTAGGVDGNSMQDLYVAATTKRSISQIVEDRTANNMSVIIQTQLKAGKVSHREIMATPTRNQTTVDLLEELTMASLMSVIHGSIDVAIAVDAASTNRKAGSVLATERATALEVGEEMPANVPRVSAPHPFYSKLKRFWLYDPPHWIKCLRTQISHGGIKKNLLFGDGVAFNYTTLDTTCRAWIRDWCGTTRPMAGGSGVTYQTMITAVNSKSSMMNVGSATKFFSRTFQGMLDRVKDWLLDGRPKAQLPFGVARPAIPVEDTDVVNMLDAFRPYQVQADQFMDDMNGRDVEAETRVGQHMTRTLSWRNLDVLKRMRAFPKFLDDKAKSLWAIVNYDVRKNYISEVPPKLSLIHTKSHRHNALISI